MKRKFFAPDIWLHDGWARDVVLTVGADGRFTEIDRNGAPDGAERLNGPVIPGMANLHSHAFQRALAGLAETKGESNDSFWTWRKIMYEFLQHLTPDHVGRIARLLYLEMVKAGYTSVGEFHYLHHGIGGAGYGDPFEMSRQVIEAAREVGIAITHLPVLYMTGDFDASALEDRQLRFAGTPDWILNLVSALSSEYHGDDNVFFGVAPHSLRAVPTHALTELVSGLTALDRNAPIHIHISEQMKEVEACLAHFGKRPMEYLFDSVEVDSRYCLVHATHGTDAEIEAIAKSGAVAGICPTTEANLGDGLFQIEHFRGQGGQWGIGSDSHISISPIEELRWLEYGQRLQHQSRAIIASDQMKSVGACLWSEAALAGGKALGRGSGAIYLGARADFLVLDNNLVQLGHEVGDRLMDRMIFAGNVNPVRDVFIAGNSVVRDGKHPGEEEIIRNYGPINQLVSGF